MMNTANVSKDPTLSLSNVYDPLRITMISEPLSVLAGVLEKERLRLQSQLSLSEKSQIFFSMYDLLLKFTLIIGVTNHKLKVKVLHGAQ